MRKVKYPDKVLEAKIPEWVWLFLVEAHIRIGETLEYHYFSDKDALFVGPKRRKDSFLYVSKAGREAYLDMMGSFNKTTKYLPKTAFGSWRVLYEYPKNS